MPAGERLARGEAFRGPRGTAPRHEQPVMDQVAVFLLVFHELVRPLAEERCEPERSTGRLRRTILDRHRFVQQCSAWACRELENMGALLTHERYGQYLAVAVLRQMVHRLLDVAAPRWGWAGFYTTADEANTLERRCIQAYMTGRVLADESQAP